MKQRVAIIGGGITGLAAAERIRQAADEGCDVQFALYEKDDRLGGKILTEKVDGFTIDGGPDCYLSQKPWVAQFAKKLGIADRLAPSNDDKKKTFIYVQGRFNLLPDGVMMMVPTKFWPFATTRLFTLGAKLRMGMELFIPRRKSDEDESLASFVNRRLGRQCLDRLAEPLVGGVHASDPDTMSLKATFPRFLEMEQKYGSMIRGFLAARKNAPAPPPPKPGEPKRTFFMTLKGGMQELTDAAADAAGREDIHQGVSISKIEAEDGRYRLTFEDGRPAEVFDAVIIATEAWAASELTASVDEEMSKTLGEIPHTTSATVSLAFDKDDVAADAVEAFGFVVPAIEERKIMASTFTSTKWFDRTDDGHVLLRAFVGGPNNQHLLEGSDEDIVEIVRAEWKDMLGIDAEPTLSRVYRWENGMPQYTVGHLDRLDRLDGRLEANEGLFLAGGSYRGVGIGNCIDSGAQAAEKALACLQAGGGEAGHEVAEDEVRVP